MGGKDEFCLVEFKITDLSTAIFNMSTPVCNKIYMPGNEHNSCPL